MTQVVLPFRAVYMFVPEAVVDIAVKVFTAVAPNPNDGNGAEWCQTKVSPDGNEPSSHRYIGIVPEGPMQQRLIDFFMSPAALKALIEAEFAISYPELTAPTLEECETFLNALVTYYDYPDHTEPFALLGVQQMAPDLSWM